MTKHCIIVTEKNAHTYKILAPQYNLDIQQVSIALGPSGGMFWFCYLGSWKLCQQMLRPSKTEQVTFKNILKCEVRQWKEFHGAARKGHLLLKSDTV